MKASIDEVVQDSGGDDDEDDESEDSDDSGDSGEGNGEE